MSLSLSLCLSLCLSVSLARPLSLCPSLSVCLSLSVSLSALGDERVGAGQLVESNLLPLYVFFVLNFTQQGEAEADGGGLWKGRDEVGGEGRGTGMGREGGNWGGEGGRMSDSIWYCGTGIAIGSGHGDCNRKVE